LAELLLERGDRVAATARSTTSLARLDGERHGRLFPVALDLADTASVRAAVAAAFAALGRVDVIVSNAGFGLVGAAEELTDEQIDEQVRANLIGPVQLARAVIPRLRRQGGGHIIQVTSMVPVAIPGLSLYHATKWGLEGFWEAVIPEIAPFGIGVTMVQPGSARTSFGRNVAVAPALPDYEQTPVATRRAHRPRRPGENGPGDHRVRGPAGPAATAGPRVRRLPADRGGAARAAGRAGGEPGGHLLNRRRRHRRPRRLTPGRHWPPGRWEWRGYRVVTSVRSS
jgi:NAD(P)-dependent dehydrogenase (short-subunit alcohol dehydrogenase family)